ncbi:hypothetical protein JCM19239_1454 [Vibrio variabilis]|uniref:Uncharacterized protein n=1 Tax=Vibrio variabilis TaxID=990271 RepID=A0ABQ0JG53_9VIBR|nr:hypothetical protein JCM19239_1454 [Vibrio variabilis]
MLKSIVGLLILFLTPSYALVTMSEADCKSQAMAAHHLLEMVENGSLPSNGEYEAKLHKALEHINKGEFCAARSIVLNLNR